MQDELTSDQRNAEKLIREWYLNTDDQVFVLSGYAGTGKTFLLKRVVEGLGLEAGREAVFVAPTGKAASVLVKNGTPASTIHSLIYVRDEEDFDVNEACEAEICYGEHLVDGRVRSYIDGRNFSFEYRAKKGANLFTD